MSRTVGIFLKGTPRSLVEAWLDAFADRSGDQWCYSGGQDEIVLFIHIPEKLREEFETEEYTDFINYLGEEPSVGIFADVSGRFDADEEVKTFITSILGQFEGVAFDEFVHHWWTLDEIINDTMIDGLHYFDYRENYRRHFKKS